MKWLLLSCFLLWARHGEGGALKCLPGDDECSQSSEQIEQQQIDIRRPTGAGAGAPAECLAGSEWVSNCHSCRCSEDGEAVCAKQAQCDSIIEDPIRCKPNTTFERECNTCMCLENGLGLCTMEICERVPSSAPVPSMATMPKGVDCAPGSSWQSQCNDCVCSPEGRRYCTERACPGQESEPLVRCAPNTHWKYECNRCWCNSGRAMCTKMGCATIPSDMNFDEEKEIPESQEILEPNIAPEVPDINSNALQESDIKDDIFTKDNLEEDQDKTPDAVEENLNEEVLKDLEQYDHNDVDTPIHIQGQVVTDFAANTDAYVNKDIQLLEVLSYDNQDQNVEEHLDTFQNLKGVNRDIEVLETPYLDYNRQGDGMHRVQKRSACKPDQDFKEDCNTCKCSASGQSYSCTQNECMDSDKEPLDKEVEVFMETEGVDHIERHSVCKPSAVFYAGCNPCHCNADGTDFSCTNKPCSLPEDVEVFHELNASKSAKNSTKKVCVENRVFIMNCNTCWCNEDGTSYYCTRKACENEPTEEPVVEDGKPEISKSAKNSTKKVCVENRMFIMNCNTCWCNEDGTSYYCTRKACENEPTEEPVVEDGKPEKLRIIKRECRPDEVFEIDCNMCRCNPDGKSYSCTRRACFDEDRKNETQSRKIRATPQEAPKNCLPGQEFRLDCNKCLCDNAGQDFSCTRIDCNALNNNNNGARRKRDVSQTGSQRVPTDCDPGSVFDQGCNVCRCTADGRHATCTLKRCAQNKVNSTLTATESSFRCNPGEQFKQSCNDCSCSADGKSVFCTLLICDEDLTPSRQ